MSNGKEPVQEMVEEGADGVTENGEEIDFSDTASVLAFMVDELAQIKAILELGFSRQLKAAATGGKVRALGAPIGPAALFKALALGSDKLVIEPNPEDAAFVASKIQATPVPPPKVSQAGALKDATKNAHASAAWKSLTKEEKTMFAARYAEYVKALPEPEPEEA